MSAVPALPPIPAAVVAAWPALDAATLSPLSGGLINVTMRVKSPAHDWVLQRLHPVFGAAVNANIHAVTTHLERSGLSTPTLVPTADGALWVSADDGVWRMQTFMPGSHAYDRMPSETIAAEAGKLVARFHAAMAGFEHDYAFKRTGVHDTAAHVTTLQRALAAHPKHALFGDVEALADEALARLARLPTWDNLPTRHSHGDLKLTNLLFTTDEKGLCLVDLDTVGHMPWPIEMADALRSWCNPAGEVATGVAFDTAVFAAAITAYAADAGAAWTAVERDALVPAIECICLELAVRFLADALNESYFGWDAAAFPSRGAHNLARAEGQLALARDVALKRGDLEAIVQAVWPAPRREHRF